MRSRLLLFAVFPLLGGCAIFDPQTCAAAGRVLDECDLTQRDDTPFVDYALGECADGCEAACVAQATCGELEFHSCENPTFLDACLIECGVPTGCIDEDDDTSTPLVLSFDGAPVTFLRGGGTFDFGSGTAVTTDWPSPDTPWLAWDRDNNGLIDDATELFGDATPLPSGARGANGFVALAQFDTDADGWVTPSDEEWALLRVWTDADADHTCAAAEVDDLASVGVLGFELRYELQPACDARGNCVFERSRLRSLGADGVLREGAVFDVHLRGQPVTGRPAR
ncbi:MAG: calcium-binding protein [Pseudomonadota bacterium]|nr:calcium-binding protein [Pseudomonadota bacterium]